MRSIDAIEKITRIHPEYLSRHKKEVLSMMDAAVHKEVKWHLALLVSRLELTARELMAVWQNLVSWAIDQKQSRIVRVNALQGLYDLSGQHPAYEVHVHPIIRELAEQKIPSITARIRKWGLADK